jgi:integrase
MEGHLYQRGKSQTWYLRYDEPTSTDAKRRPRNVRIGRMSKSSAEAKKRQILRQVDEGILQERSTGTLEQFLAEWLESRKHNLANTTYARYKQMIDRDINPVIGKVRLAKLNESHIEVVHRSAYRRGLSKRSCLHIHRVLHKAFRDAVRRRKLTRNVVALVDAPNPEEREHAAITPERVELLIQAARGTRLEVPVAVSAVTGLRRGEILALRWRNIHLWNIDRAKAKLYVAESLEQTREFGVQFKSPKSKSSKRVIPLSRECAQLLLAHRAEQERAKKEAGAAYDDRDLVFPNADGSPWPPDTFTMQFGKLAALVGLKGFRFHDLRHAFASLTLAGGVSVKEVQTLLGHSSPTVTLSVYARSMEGLGRQAVNELSRSLLGGRSKKAS